MNDDLKDLRDGDSVWFRRRENGKVLLGGRWLAGTIEKSEFYGDEWVAVYEDELRVLRSDIRRRGPSRELVTECQQVMHMYPNDAPEMKRLLTKLLVSLEPPKEGCTG